MNSVDVYGKDMDLMPLYMLLFPCFSEVIFGLGLYGFLNMLCDTFFELFFNIFMSSAHSMAMASCIQCGFFNRKNYDFFVEKKY